MITKTLPIDVEQVKQGTAFASDYNPPDSSQDFIQVTNWSNIEGVDIYLSRGEQRIALTYNELRAINQIVKQIDK